MTLENTLKTLAKDLSAARSNIDDIAKMLTTTDQPAPVRYFSPEAAGLLRRAGITIERGMRVTVAELDAAAERAGFRSAQSIQLKLEMKAAGVLTA